MKYIDLTNQIRRDVGGNLAPTADVLRWLDSHPGQVPGRTITMTVSEWAEEVALMDNRPDRILTFLGRFIDFHITPDPEPTNMEKLQQYIRESGYSITYGGHPVDAGELASVLDDDGVKAPDHD